MRLVQKTIGLLFEIFANSSSGGKGVIIKFKVK
jgi:hypothetical protein